MGGVLLPADSERLSFRPLEDADLPALRGILTDAETMVAYEGPFSDAECLEWLVRQQRRYATDGFGMWAVTLRETGEFVGQCGLTTQAIGGERRVEVGYLFLRSSWGHGYAIEAARACRDHAFTVLAVDEVWSKIRDSNLASMNVAIRNGMTVRLRWTQHYRGVDMPHLGFRITRDEWSSLPR